MSNSLIQGVCILIVILGRVVNALVPLVFAHIVQIFEEGSHATVWLYLLAYVGLRLLQSSGGLAAIRDVSSYLVHLAETDFVR